MDAHQIELKLLAERERIREIHQLQPTLVVIRDMKSERQRKWFPTFLQQFISRRRRAVVANQTV